MYTYIFPCDDCSWGGCWEKDRRPLDSEKGIILQSKSTCRRSVGWISRLKPPTHPRLNSNNGQDFCFQREKSIIADQISISLSLFHGTTIYYDLGPKRNGKLLQFSPSQNSARSTLIKNAILTGLSKIKNWMQFAKFDNFHNYAVC